MTKCFGLFLFTFMKGVFSNYISPDTKLTSAWMIKTEGVEKPGQKTRF